MQGSRDLSAAALLTEYRIDRGSLSSGTWNKYLCISITIFCSTNGTEEPKINIEKGGAIYDEPIGPPNRYDFVLTVDDDINTSDDDETDHSLLKKIDSTKKYVIQDLKQFGLLLATAVGGLTIFAVEKIGELFTLRLSELLFEKGVSCVDDLRKLAQEAFENTIGRIADIDLFDFKKVSLADGVGFEIGSFSLEVNYNDGAINSVTTYKGKTKETGADILVWF